MGARQSFKCRSRGSSITLSQKSSACKPSQPSTSAFAQAPPVARLLLAHPPPDTVRACPGLSAQMNHIQNPVLQWSTQNHVKKIEGGRSYLRLRLSLTNLHLPGFDCDSSCDLGEFFGARHGTNGRLALPRSRAFARAGFASRIQTNAVTRRVGV